MKAVNDIVQMIGATAGSRFQAAARLTARDRRNGKFLLGAAAGLIVLSVVQIALPPSSLATMLGVAVTCLSVVTLALSGVQLGSNDAVEAELMHRCGLEINEVRRHLESRTPPVAQADIDSALNDYNRILLRFALNHEERDFIAYKLSKPWLYPDLDHRFGQAQPTIVMTRKEAFFNRQKLRARLYGPVIGKVAAIVVGFIMLLAAGGYVAQHLPIGAVLPTSEAARETRSSN